MILNHSVYLRALSDAKRARAKKREGIFLKKIVHTPLAAAAKCKYAFTKRADGYKRKDRYTERGAERSLAEKLADSLSL
jgi:hypothetical protein